MSPETSRTRLIRHVAVKLPVPMLDQCCPLSMAMERLAASLGSQETRRNHTRPHGRNFVAGLVPFVLAFLVDLFFVWFPIVAAALLNRTVCTNRSSVWLSRLTHIPGQTISQQRAWHRPARRKPALSPRTERSV